MKKNIFSILILTLFTAFFTLLFTTCEDKAPVKEEEDYSVDVVYSDDWRYVSIYLEGQDAPIAVTMNKNTRGAARAMTPDTARRGFDYFEVFFYFNGTVRRAAWEIGQKASIMDVYRGSTAGVDYSITSLNKISGGSNPGSSGGKPISEPTSSAAGASVLFAGRKADKTLLAVGKLVSVNADEPVEDPQERSTFINNGTVFVTFELSAIKANTSAVIEKSSFFTDNTGGNNPAAANTKVISVRIGDRYFPLYLLPGGKPKISAQYTLGIDGGWDDFAGSIFVMEKGEVDKRQARYPAGSGKYWYAKYGEDLTTVVNMTNNQTARKKIKDGTYEGKELENPVKFEIDTSRTVNKVTKDNGIFTFSFSIPVCALSFNIPKDEEDCWYIRPAYASYYLNIDNGVTTGEFSDKNIGGGVLCAVDLEAVNYEIPAERR